MRATRNDVVWTPIFNFWENLHLRNLRTRRELSVRTLRNSIAKKNRYFSSNQVRVHARTEYCARYADGVPCRHWPPAILAAAITAWVRLSTPSFCRIADTWALMVASETPSS